jgi:hypothetical protein
MQPEQPTPKFDGSTNPYSVSSNLENISVTRDSQGTNTGDGTGGLIPFKNPKALIAYYLGIFSGLPLIGLPIGVAAFVLGIMGLRDRARNPIIKGSIHAGIGIGCGGFFALLWTLVLVLMVVTIFVR